MQARAGYVRSERRKPPQAAWVQVGFPRLGFRGDGSSSQCGGALAHRVRHPIDSYRRTDLFERRRRLVDVWVASLARESRGSEVAPGR